MQLQIIGHLRINVLCSRFLIVPSVAKSTENFQNISFCFEILLILVIIRMLWMELSCIGPFPCQHKTTGFFLVNFYHVSEITQIISILVPREINV